MSYKDEGADSMSYAKCEQRDRIHSKTVNGRGCIGLSVSVGKYGVLYFIFQSMEKH